MNVKDAYTRLGSLLEVGCANHEVKIMSLDGKGSVSIYDFSPAPPEDGSVVHILQSSFEDKPRWYLEQKSAVAVLKMAIQQKNPELLVVQIAANGPTIGQMLERVS